MNVNGKKKIIELFGIYWHVPGDEEIRRQHFAKYGYDTLVVWETELFDQPKLLQKINTFLANPNVKLTNLTSIEHIEKETIVYNFEVEDNHNYFANGTLVHNCGYALAAWLYDRDAEWSWKRL
ncbi:MAG: hypothetical protein KGL95_03265 [Patescibacteria group bacterium]|nr:hypothetical protein [Patescibacteria group bacterium]